MFGLVQIGFGFFLVIALFEVLLLVVFEIVNFRFRFFLVIS